MKKNRSNKYTTGLVITNNTNNDRFLFFELDNPVDIEDHQKVIDVYRSFGLDLLLHRSGHGRHYLSPTLIDVETWKKAMVELKQINTKCPMTTLRWIPNKYTHEREIWFHSFGWYNTNDDRRNSDQLSNLLNKNFQSMFEGSVDTDLKFVRYPLP